MQLSAAGSRPNPGPVPRSLLLPPSRSLPRWRGHRHPRAEHAPALKYFKAFFSLGRKYRSQMAPVVEYFPNVNTICATLRLNVIILTPGFLMSVALKSDGLTASQNDMQS